MKQNELDGINIGGNENWLVDNVHLAGALQISCGCTKPEVLEEEGTYKIKATYTAKPVPKHLKKDGKTSYDSKIRITVYYKNGETDVLTLSAKVVE